MDFIAKEIVIIDIVRRQVSKIRQWVVVFALIIFALSIATLLTSINRPICMAMVSHINLLHHGLHTRFSIIMELENSLGQRNYPNMRPQLRVVIHA